MGLRAVAPGVPTQRRRHTGLLDPRGLPAPGAVCSACVCGGASTLLVPGRLRAGCLQGLGEEGARLRGKEVRELVSWAESDRLPGEENSPRFPNARLLSPRFLLLRGGLAPPDPPTPPLCAAGWLWGPWLQPFCNCLASVESSHAHFVSACVLDPVRLRLP